MSFWQSLTPSERELALLAHDVGYLGGPNPSSMHEDRDRVIVDHFWEQGKREKELRESGPVFGRMNLTRAKKIVTAIASKALLEAGMTHASVPCWLEEISLQDMLEAKKIVEADNRSRSAQSGRQMLTFIPDDRLISAVYTILHYKTAGSILVSDDGNRCLAVFTMPSFSKDAESQK